MEARYGKTARTIAGIPKSTWNYVRSGARQASPRTAARLRAAFRAALIRHETELRTWPGVVLYARVMISQDDRTRPLSIGRWTDDMGKRRLDGRQDRMVTHWLAGNDFHAAREMEEVVEEALGLFPGSFRLHVHPIDLRYFPSQSAADTWANTKGGAG
jgi:hypothetical protein